MYLLGLFPVVMIMISVEKSDICSDINMRFVTIEKLLN